MISDEELSGIAKIDGRKLCDDYAKHYGFSLPYDIWNVLSESQAIAAELLQRREEEHKTCKWAKFNYGDIETSCGYGFLRPFHEFKFCPFCGHRIEENP